MKSIINFISNALDTVESFILNYARRVITGIILIASVIGLVVFIVALYNLYASPSVTNTDVFDVPVFEKPIDPPEVKTEIEIEEVEEEKEPSWIHPMPDYEKELKKIAKTMMPLYGIFFGWEGSEKDYQKVIEFTANSIQPLAEVLSENQFDEVVDGLEDYIGDKVSWLRKDLKKNENIIVPKKLDPDDLPDLETPNDQISTFLSYPFNDYIEGVNNAYLENTTMAEIAKLEADAKKIVANFLLLFVGVILGAIITLIFFLLIFKTENSLRRSANSLEKINKLSSD